MSIIASWFFGCFFLVTLPGTYARLLAVTWGKPVFGCFPIFYWIGFLLAFWPVEFGVLSAHRFWPVFLVTHPFLGFAVFSPWFWSALRRV